MPTPQEFDIEPMYLIYLQTAVIYKLKLGSLELMGYGALYNLKNLQIIATHAPNPSYVNFTFIYKADKYELQTHPGKFLMKMYKERLQFI